MVQVNHQTERWQLSIVDTEGLEPESEKKRSNYIMEHEIWRYLKAYSQREKSHDKTHGWI